MDAEPHDGNQAERSVGITFCHLPPALKTSLLSYAIRDTVERMRMRVPQNSCPPLPCTRENPYFLAGIKPARRLRVRDDAHHFLPLLCFKRTPIGKGKSSHAEMQNTPNTCSVNYRRRFVPDWDFFASSRARSSLRASSFLIFSMRTVACKNAPPSMQSFAAFANSRSVLGGPPCAKNFAMSEGPYSLPGGGKEKTE